MQRPEASYLPSGATTAGQRAQVCQVDLPHSVWLKLYTSTTARGTQACIQASRSASKWSQEQSTTCQLRAEQGDLASGPSHALLPCAGSASSPAGMAWE